MNASLAKILPAGVAAVLLASALALPAGAQQLGPYEIEMKGTTFKAQFIRRDKDTVWVRRVAPDGSLGPQAGYDKADIAHVAMPRPPFFTNLDAIVSSPVAVPPTALIRAHSAIDKFVESTTPYRDLPGVVCDEALYLKGQIYDMQHKYEDAISAYDALRSMDPPSSFATNALVRVGIDYQRTTNALECITCLSGIPLPEDDENLLSDLLFALGDAFAEVGNYDNALQSYLTLVVFYPYVRDNEPRALAKVLPCYAALKEWEPLYRAIQDIHATYPGSPAAAAADKAAKDYKDELAKAGLFVDGERVVEDAQVDAVEGTVAAKDAPEHTQLHAPDDPNSTISSTVEYPDDL